MWFGYISGHPLIDYTKKDIFITAIQKNRVAPDGEVLKKANAGNEKQPRCESKGGGLAFGVQTNFEPGKLSANLCILSWLPLERRRFYEIDPGPQNILCRTETGF
jgi:hypothetical protein